MVEIEVEEKLSLFIKAELIKNQTLEQNMVAFNGFTLRPYTNHITSCMTLIAKLIKLNQSTIWSLYCPGSRRAFSLTY
ncbi:hypothetical protein T4D_4885 [Trichinella pseudospiralis]|uniref:Uncharacterized protein n=1 Tax=Trichinella pseudospiralis TaxID=6337 RepID=A0A0V1FWT1_TRIPS|nr:hypothetical protein T4D_4885 [Trichinella pseudospiralis]